MTNLEAKASLGPHRVTYHAKTILQTLHIFVLSMSYVQIFMSILIRNFAIRLWDTAFYAEMQQ